MKRNTLEKVLWSLQSLTPVIRVAPDVAREAVLSVHTMFGSGPIEGSRR
jgi:quinolinate synthase